jgi:uncharacterized protein (DUF2236 family)
MADTRPESSVEPLDDFDMRDHLPGVVGMVGAAANVIMQLGRPGVGHGVVESTVDSGNVMLHPWKRLRTTTSYLTVALFGSDADRAAYREAVNRSHRPVRSGPDSPVRYNAFDPELQLWVAACLYVGFRDVRATFLGEPDPVEAEQLYQHCRRLGTTLQVPPEAWPADLAAFDEYWRDGVARVRYDDVVRDHLLAIVDLRMVPRWMRIGSAAVNRFFTIGMLPPEFRRAMGLDWSARQERWYVRVVRPLRLTSRLTPRWLRFLPVRLQLMEVRLRIRRGWSLV